MLYCRRFFLYILLLLLAAVPALAAAPTMLLDINAEGVVDNYDAGVAGRFLPLGRNAHVLSQEPTTGTERWVTDGTDAGTRPLWDRCPGPCSGAAILMEAVGNVGFFGLTENSRSSFWRSDGTLPGTFSLVTGKAPCRQDTALLGRTLFLSMGNPFDDFPVCTFWKTDGTVAGTVQVKDVDPVELTAAPGRVFFASYSPETGSGGVWVSDGTPEGTVQLHEWTFAVPSHLYTVGDRLFFIAPDDGYELWTSDGTPGGTRPVTHFAPVSPFVPRYDGSGVYVVQALDDRLAFLANDGTSGRELWLSDGTTAGTRPATAFTVASPFLGLDKWHVEKLGARLVLPANDGTSGNRLWTTTGAAASTAPISGCPGGCPEVSPSAQMVRQGGRLAFVGEPDRSSLWVTDGTGAGTRRVLDTQDEDGVAQLDALLGRIFFTAEVGDNGDRFLLATDQTLATSVALTSIEARELQVRPVAVGGVALFGLPKNVSRHELWRSDGTPGGTFPVTRIGQTGASSSPQSLVPAGDAVRFQAFSGGSTGLWTSHGTAGTTTALFDQVGYAQRLAPLGELTLGDSYGSLWRSDGTAAGSYVLTSPDEGDPSISSIAPLTNGRAVLGMRAFDTNGALWATDGSVAGTHEIFDVPAEAGGLSEVVAAGAEAFFVTTQQTHEDRLWSTDGTAAGTHAITGSLPRFIETPLDVARLGSTVFFVGDTDQTGIELWRTDGTAAGAHPLAEGRASDPQALTVHQGALYFFADVRDPYGFLGLWRSDGTEAGTVYLRTLKSLNGFPRPELVPFGNLLLFAAGIDDGVELWRTDGTAAGTFQVRDINSGVASSSPARFVVVGNRAYFTAYDKSHGNELWETDGTAAGTRLVQDIAPGTESSAPDELTAAGGRLYFTADDGVHGREPWVYAPGGAACVASETVLCLRGGRFKVEADWRDFEGHSGRGRAVALTPDTGYFWFFDPSNVEVILKVLDGQGLNGHQWVFYGALSSVEYALTVTDTQTGAARRYTNLPGRLGSVADTEAFGPKGASATGVMTTGPAPELGEAIVSARTTEATGICTPSATRLCLNGGRFAVEARWKDFQGKTGTGQAVPLGGGDTGYFWFFDASNVEVVLKVLDGRPLNNKFWVFYGALSNVEYTLTVTDTETGAVKTYTNPSGRLASVADTGAF
jgi:ELWxxDGT repeat protein